MNIAAIATNNKVFLTQSQISTLKHTHLCSDDDFDDACDKAVGLVAEHKIKTKALSIVEEQLNILSLEENWEEYDKLTLIKAIIKQTNI